MPLGRLIKHQRTTHYDKNTQIQCQRREVAIADKCSEATFSLTGKDEAECIDGVEVFKYVGRFLDRLEKNFPEVLLIIRKAHQVWG